MSGKDKPPSTDNPIKNLIQDAYGMSTRECLKEFQDAEEHPDLSPELQAPSNGYQRIKDIIDLEGIPSAAESHKRKVIRLRRIWRPLVAVAVVGSVIWGFGIGASGQKFYGYRASVADSERSDVVWDNDENINILSECDLAYEEIHNKLGIDVLKLTYMPYEMKFISLKVENDHATLKFSYNNTFLYFSQSKSNTGRSDNIVSDHNHKYNIYNEWLQKNIQVCYRQKDENEKAREYQADVEINGALYHMVGTFENNEIFTEIVEGLVYYKAK